MELDGFEIELHVDANGRCVGGSFSGPDDGDDDGIDDPDEDE